MALEKIQDLELLEKNKSQSLYNGKVTSLYMRSMWYQRLIKELCAIRIHLYMRTKPCKKLTRYLNYHDSP